MERPRIVNSDDQWKACIIEAIEALTEEIKELRQDIQKQSNPDKIDKKGNIFGKLGGKNV